MTTARADPVVTARRTHSTDLVPSGQPARSSSWFRRPTSSPSTRSSDPSALLPRQLRDCGSRWHSVRTIRCSVSGCDRDIRHGAGGCPERFDGPSVFAAVLDRSRGGFYRVSPTDRGATGVRRGSAGRRVRELSEVFTCP